MSDTGIETAEAPADAGPPPDPMDLMREIAAEGGWSPKDKWKGDPEAWRDAPDFLRKNAGALKATRKQVEAVTRMAAQQVEKATADAIRDAKAMIKEAASTGDEDLAEQGAAQLELATAKPDPEVAAFAKANPWFHPVTGEPEARAVAIAAAEKVFKLGGTVAEQVAAGEKEARKRFPELFEDGEADEPPPRRQPPAVEGGRRAASTGAPRERGWADLPAAVRSSITPSYLRTFGLTQDEAAKAYFKENP